MNKLLTFLAVMIPVIVSGCVPALHALYLKKDIVEDAGLVGTWHQDEDKSIWKFTKSTSKGFTQYKVQVDIEEDSERRKAEFVGTLVRIKGETYLDLFPAKSNSIKQISNFYLSHLVPAHTFSRVSRKNGALTLSMMNPTWIGKYLKEHPKAIAHTQVENRIVLTASTAELQAFVDKHKNTDKAFDVVVKLKKK